MRINILGREFVFEIKEKNKKYDKYILDEIKLDNDIKIYE